MRQLALEWPIEPAHGREDFLETDANRDALDFVECWPNWPERRAILTGPPGSGKTHLAAIWAATSGARRVEAADLSGIDVPVLLQGGAAVVEDVQPDSPADALFHCLNLARETGAWLLLTAPVGPALWRGGLPDLVSRLRALPGAAIGAPDEALLRAVLVKLFVDRQLMIEKPVVDYILPRIERSLDAARALVAVLDREALSRGRRISRSMAAEVLARLEDATPRPEEGD